MGLFRAANGAADAAQGRTFAVLCGAFPLVDGLAAACGSMRHGFWVTIWMLFFLWDFTQIGYRIEPHRAANLFCDLPCAMLPITQPPMSP